MSKMYITDRVIGAGVTGGTVDITVLSGIEGLCLAANRISIENETNNGTVARVGIVRNGVFITLDYFAAFNADVPQILRDSSIKVYEREDLVVRITSATTADLIVIGVAYHVEPLAAETYV